MSMRPLFRTMTKTQVEGIEAKLAAFGSAASPLKHVAYGSQPHITRLAKMQPVTEIGCGHGRSYGKPGRLLTAAATCS